ncbi:MAG: methylaspartate ammonia-lyase [Acidimicrobiaceae bacterium]|nr:methylaspartate ammonia-lyase [Acidimicrobiaceae bacterium]
MPITDVICVPVRTGFYSDDQEAIRAGARHDGFDYTGVPLTAGFSRIRQPGEAVSVMLVLDGGDIAFGDCAAVQYSGAGGRDPVFAAAGAIETIERHVVPLLEGRTAASFRELAGEIDALEVDGAPLHTAIRYGVTQAILDAVARTRGVTMAEVVRDEYETGIDLKPVPIFVQSGDDRYNNVDKMILKRVEVLPHGLVNNVEEKLGAKGEIFEEFVVWVRDRIQSLGSDDSYRPLLHFDTYGTIGMAFGADIDAVASYLAHLSEVAAPYRLRIEHPIDAGSRAGQIDALGSLRARLLEIGATVEIVVDEWCNTLEDIEAFVAAGAADVIHVKTPDLGGINNTAEALLHVRRNGLLAYCGGTCNETDRSAQICAHVAMACGADQILAKPGMGVDEGLMTVSNEMARVAAITKGRPAGRSGVAPSP